MAGSITTFIFMVIVIISGIVYGVNRSSRPIETPLSERIMQRECDLGMCEIAGHNHTKPVDTYRQEVAKIEYAHAKRELERVQKQLAAVEMEVADFRQKFRYRKYETDDFENRYVVHEVTADSGQKMIYSEKYPKFSNYVGYREGYNRPMVPKIPTKKVRI